MKMTFFMILISNPMMKCQIPSQDRKSNEDALLFDYNNGYNNEIPDSFPGNTESIETESYDEMFESFSRNIDKYCSFWIKLNDKHFLY